LFVCLVFPSVYSQAFHSQILRTTRPGQFRRKSEEKHFFLFIFLSFFLSFILLKDRVVWMYEIAKQLGVPPLKETIVAVMQAYGQLGG
jgi:hypothetical protein